MRSSNLSTAENSIARAQLPFTEDRLTSQSLKIAHYAFAPFRPAQMWTSGFDLTVPYTRIDSENGRSFQEYRQTGSIPSGDSQKDKFLASSHQVRNVLVDPTGVAF